jgi:hypothetical protein
MRYVIASASERRVEFCEEFLGTRDGIEFRSGSGPETGWDCSAAVLNFALAHDRYGGTPAIGAAQALLNRRDDGLPGWILATPPLALSAASHPPSDSAVEKHVLDSLRACLAAYLQTHDDHPEPKILIHLEAAGFDRPDLTPTLRAVAAFLP